jgi:hypothetical protein
VANAPQRIYQTGQEVGGKGRTHARGVRRRRIETRAPFTWPAGPGSHPSRHGEGHQQEMAIAAAEFRVPAARIMVQEVSESA